MNVRGALILGFLATSVHAGPISRATAKLPELPPPPQGETQWIAQSMRMNGLPMTIKAVYSHAMPDEVVYFYESWAKRAGDIQTRRWHTNQSELLSIRADSFMTTIEVQRVVSGTQGTIVTSAPPNSTAFKTETEFPHPATWRVANLQQYEDEGKEAEHITFTSRRAPIAEAQAIGALFVASGWALLNQQAARASANSYVVEAQRSAEQARVLISQDGGHRSTTLITVVWSKG